MTEPVVKVTTAALERLLTLHHGLHVCVNANGRGSTDYETDAEDDGSRPCPTYLLAEQIVSDLTYGHSRGEIVQRLPETEMWTRPAAASGTFARLKARGLKIPRRSC